MKPEFVQTKSLDFEAQLKRKCVLLTHSNLPFTLFSHFLLSPIPVSLLLLFLAHYLSLFLSIFLSPSLSPSVALYFYHNAHNEIF